MIYRSLAEIPADFGPCAITIGNFDGVHRGHREILRRVIEAAREEGWKSAALTFDPHPTKLVAPAEAPHLLTTPEQRARLMEQYGLDEILILPFTRDVANLPPEEFVRTLLVDKLGARAVVVGDNFRFGHRAAGDVTTLEELGMKYSFETEVVEAVVWRNRIISSTLIRRVIASGDVSLACRMLGRPYALEGPVVHGEGRGAKQTVPTLNLDATAEVMPKTGVYVTRTRDLENAREWPSVTNVGYNPTFDGHQLKVETYLLSSLHGPSPRAIAVEFLRWVREERKFESPDALKTQIVRDVERAQIYFRRLGEMTASAR
jgi:riboflavin kinase / FMN adenylyltransferase